MTGRLYRWPEAARVGSRVPKEKIYEQGQVTTAVRERFVTEIARINWSYKLAASTINLPPTEEVLEIQVFQIDAKDGADVSDQVLTAIDDAIPSPIIFEVARKAASGKQVRMTARYKQHRINTYKRRQYFRSQWIADSEQRQSLPTALNLSALYVALVEPLTGISVRTGEALSQVADRLKEVGKLEREIAALRRKIKNEKQFNRQVQLRRSLQTKQAELEQRR